jgi:4-carboxymuconolactone decarboxylase
MVELDTDRIERGRVLAKELNPESQGAVLRPLRGVAPDLERLYLGSVADFWDRDQLSLRERSIVRLATIAAVGQLETVAQSAISTALHIGLSKEDIAEVFLQMSPQVGMIRVIGALEALSRHPD